MAAHLADRIQSQPVRREADRFKWPRSAVLAAGTVLLLYLSWRIVTPFLPAFCWAFALALIAQPVQAWLVRKSVPKALAALLVIVLVSAVLIVPGVALGRALAAEAAGVVNRLTDAAGATNLRETIESKKFIGPALIWLDSRFDLSQEAVQSARSILGWASKTLSSLLTGSVWLLGQLGATLFALFYFLRDGEVILRNLRALVPLPAVRLNAIFARISQTIRVSLGGKIVVAAIQGTLGGAMFFWLGIPAPVFWGSVMGLLSVFPVIGAFLVWAPVAAGLALEGDWFHAVLLTLWGVLIINPVDNLLGPVLVGRTLHLHTLVIFVSVLGGIAAFGSSGVVIGPVTVAIAAALLEPAPLKSD